MHHLISRVARQVLFCTLALAAIAARAAEPSPAVSPAVFRSHSHNDYLQARPLFEALDHHMGSVEADVFLVDGQLLVAHGREQLSPTRTLRGLYLEPLAARCAAQGGGVYRNAPALILLIDIKADSARVFPELLRELAPLAPRLTHWRNGKITPGAITVLLSGDRPRAAVAAQSERFLALDGTLADLDADAPVSLVPLVSASWGTVFKWKGVGAMPDDEREKLRALATRAHAQGRALRFWAAPDRAECWAEQFAAGVDYIHTDQPAALEAFLAARPAR
ncbi:MAG: hypothetical protein RLZZ15_490 [Verrucomicrobiota bacterium]|jgi:hypothetical protein